MSCMCNFPAALVLKVQLGLLWPTPQLTLRTAAGIKVLLRITTPPRLPAHMETMASL